MEHLLVWLRIRVIFMLFVFIYTYWCPTRFPYQMMFVSFNSSTMGVISGAGIANPFWSTWVPLIFSGVLVSRSFVLYVVYCTLLFPLCPFSFGNCIVYTSSISRFCLPIWYLQTFLMYNVWNHTFIFVFLVPSFSISLFGILICVYSKFCFSICYQGSFNIKAFKLFQFVHGEHQLNHVITIIMSYYLLVTTIRRHVEWD